LVLFESLDDYAEVRQHITSTNDEVLADAQLLERCLGILRPVEREVLLLFDLEGYTAREISELTGHPQGTVLSLMRRGRHGLKHYLCSLGEEMVCAEVKAK
jgi:RNA polymerase sigma-70 factor (ECF subfamily)